MKEIVKPAVTCEACGHEIEREVIQYVCDYCKKPIKEEKTEISDGAFHIGRWKFLLALERHGRRFGDIGFLQNSDEFHFCSNEHRWRYIAENLELFDMEKYAFVHFGVSDRSWSVRGFLEELEILKTIL